MDLSFGNGTVLSQNLQGELLSNGCALSVAVCAFTSTLLLLQRWWLQRVACVGSQASAKVAIRGQQQANKVGADVGADVVRNSDDSEEEEDLPFAAREDDCAMIPNETYHRRPVNEMRDRAAQWLEEVSKRRSVRQFSTESFPVEIMHDIVRAAGKAPSGANLQPWTYVIVQNPELKSQIRDAVEREEEINYARRMSEAWKADLAHLGTNSSKPYLEEAPYIVCIFKHTHRIGKNGEKLNIYYPEQSAGMSAGMFMLAVHNAGLCTVTTTPMGAEAAIRDLLGRPVNERLYLLMPVGFPAEGCKVPNITKKPSEQLMVTL